MRFSSEHYSGMLIGHKVTEVQLRGRDYRPDSHHIFTDKDSNENVWYKTFSVGLDNSCREAYFVFGLLLDEGNVVKETGTGVMYMDSGAGNCMCFRFNDDEAADVDDSDDFRAFRDADGDDEDTEVEFPPAKRIMDVLPLDWMLSDRAPYALEHEAAMLLRGNWLPESFSPDGAPLPRHLVDRFITGDGQGPDSEYPILDEISFTLTSGTGDDFEGALDVLSHRGTRYFACNFDGSLVAGVWRIDDFSVDSYASTGSGMGNLFNRPHALDDNPYDYAQACLLLIDFYNKDEFMALLG